MAGKPYFESIAALPRTLPIFPLPGALLLPAGTLPLNIFEPRYLAMIDDALSGSRMIGMIQPDDESGDVGAAHTYTIGCTGRITQFTETEDGRYLISLSGIARFRVARELPKMEGGYRLVEPDYGPFAADLKADDEVLEIDRTRLFTHLRAFFRARQIDANWEAMEKADDASLVTALAMVCPFATAEKQALLEATNGSRRAETLIALLQMGGAEDDEDAPRQ